MIQGHINSVSRSRLAGWAADADEPDGEVEVIVRVDGEVRGRVVANLPSEGLRKLGKFGEGRHAFHYSFSPPLSPHRRHEVSVEADGAGKPLSKGQITFEPIGTAEIERALASAADRQLRPVYVTFVGRSGSTMLMTKLAAHPEIVAGKVYPLEVQISSYYAHCLDVLTAMPDRAAEQAIEERFRDDRLIGSNPVAGARFEPAFSSDEIRSYFFQIGVPGELAASFRRLTSLYYACLAAEAGKKPRYFAEKLHMSPPYHRRRVRALYGDDLKEIVIVRDLRDVYCSQLASHRNFIGKQSDDRLIPQLKRSGAEICDIVRNRRDANVLVVRYEDLITAPDATLQTVFDYLDLPSPRAVEPAEDSLFKKHATSSSPNASIGRWRHDLSEAEQAACNNAFAEYLGLLGYQRQ